jgi:hypothetical protein
MVFSSMDTAGARARIYSGSSNFATAGWREEAERKEKRKKLQAERRREKNRQAQLQMGPESLLDGKSLGQVKVPVDPVPDGRKL